MTDLSEFEKGMIIGMRCTGCSVTETAIYLGRARSTVSAVMTAYKKCRNVTSGKHNSGRKRKLTNRDKRVLTRIVARKHKQSLSQITSEVNSHLRNPISARTVQREFHASNLYGRVGIRKLLVTARHALQRRQWCRTHRQWTPQQWQQVIWSDESTFTLFQTTGRVYVWRTPKEAFAPECIVPTVKHGGGSLMVWGAISWRGLGPLVTLHGKVKAAHYVNILVYQVHPFVQTSFPGECPLYQDDNAPIHTAKIVQEWFAEHKGESKLRARFPPPSTISVLETALHEEWLHIPLQVVHDLYASIPRRIQSVIQSKGRSNSLLIKLFSSFTVERSENASFIENWNNDYEEWIEQNATQTQIYDLGDSNLTLWKESTEDEVMYDIYNRQQNEILEIDEEGLELTDNWLVLDQDEEWQSDEDETVIVNSHGNHTKALLSSSMIVGLQAAIERLRTSHTCSMGLRLALSNTWKSVRPSAMIPQATSSIVILFDNVRGSISTPGFSQEENTSGVSVQTESRLITEGNQSLIILCSRQVFSAS
ncbi:transposable element Tcb1 transposase [Trichonephila clavipes]|nr:transposable element Tcb1 transposase [Trichonephila clavipes]